MRRWRRELDHEDESQASVIRGGRETMDLSLSLPFVPPQPRAHRSSLSRDSESAFHYSNQKGFFCS